LLEWITRGLGKGTVTTQFPRRVEEAPAGFRGRVEVTDASPDPRLEAVCPTGAIKAGPEQLLLDRARCILCGACVAAAPGRFRFVSEYEIASRSRESLIVGAEERDEPAPPGPEALPPTLRQQARALGRSIHIRHVDAGSDGSEEWEVAALANPYYDMQRLGLYFTLSPRHADILLVTGELVEPMATPLQRAYEVMGEPKAVVAAGTDACSGGFSANGSERGNGIDRLLRVDVYVPGSPPSPIALLHGLLLAAGIVTRASA
jgi:Ni,Fe-hydrogenase III small subunit/formate hydrogenlyase subunit 6/NADH:ubiquinone oxidoreductase subunit I